MDAALADGMEPRTRPPKPIAAELATGKVGLIDLARHAGHNMLRVIPEETLRETYIRGPAKIHWVTDPELITEVLIGPGRAFPKSKFTKDILGSAVGHGMMLAEGQVWREQRHRYSPLFAARNLPMLSAHFAATGAEMAERALSAAAGQGGEIDVTQLSQEATLTDISRVMFSGTDTVDPAVIRKGLRAYFDYISHISLFDLMGLPRWIPRAKWLLSTRPVTDMRALARQVIEVRRAENRDDAQDFLDLMIDALKADHEEIETTVDNLLTFVVAGHETAANTMAWGIYLLALHPGVQARLRDEVMTACPEGPITYEAVKQMPHLLAHVRETLRLYPAGAFFARDADEGMRIGDVDLAPGDQIYISVYSLHRNEALWDDPDDYRPDRFLDWRAPRGQFIPFGDGPRICIGAQYAETEIMVLMASLLRRMRVSLTGKPLPRPVLTFTMRPDGPMRLRLDPVGG